MADSVQEGADVVEGVAHGARCGSTPSAGCVSSATAHDSDTDKCDREEEKPSPEEKPSAYAQTGIPVYLLIDRDTCEAFVYSEPDGDTYANLTRRPFGRTIDLPSPVDITFETGPVRDWVR
ncbi:Uma2 family endonuclease [Streptomyces sp. NPDC059928]|uniref:Uma2 family endonuclease n=1 Tax=unclassified Streptomyces TaxID=2593676 RepID=UPI0036653D27